MCGYLLLWGLTCPVCWAPKRFDSTRGSIKCSIIKEMLRNMTVSVCSISLCPWTPSVQQPYLYTIAILRVLSLIVFVHIHVHKCVCSSARLPGSCTGVEPQAEEKLYLYWPTCYILLWEPVMSSFMSLWWCRMDVDLTWDNTICLFLLKKNYPHCFFITHMVHSLYCNYPLLFYLAYFKQY